MQGLDQLKKDLQPHYCEHGHGVCDGLLVCSDVLKEMVKLVEPEVHDKPTGLVHKGTHDQMVEALKQQMTMGYAERDRKIEQLQASLRTIYRTIGDAFVQAFGQPPGIAPCAVDAAQADVQQLGDEVKASYRKGLDDALAVCHAMSKRIQSSCIPGASFSAIVVEEVEVEIAKLKEGK